MTTEYYNPKKEQRQNLISNIDKGFKYLLNNPDLNIEIRPDVKKIYVMYKKLRLMIDVERD